MNGSSWGFNVSEPDTHLTYMIDIALTTEIFACRWRCAMSGGDGAMSLWINEMDPFPGRCG